MDDARFAGVEAALHLDREVLRQLARAVDAGRVVGHGLEVGMRAVRESRIRLAAGEREADEGLGVDVDVDLVEDGSGEAGFDLGGVHDGGL